MFPIMVSKIESPTNLALDKSTSGNAMREQSRRGCNMHRSDICCIDDKNLVELSEAIIFMFRRYQLASVCFVYLSDVPIDDNPRQNESSFQTSKWFQRG